MLALLTGAAVLFLLVVGLRAFERASVSSIKSLLVWIAALGGLSFALLLVLTGRFLSALSALVLFGPLVWQQLQTGGRGPGRRQAGEENSGRSQGFRQGSFQQGTFRQGNFRPGNFGPGGFQRKNSQRAPGKPEMSRADAYDVLGLAPGASEKAIRDAHRRLMRTAHPDAGGSDWLASRVNRARDILLG
jgi:DnaJ homolog subfamily C member 19